MAGSQVSGFGRVGSKAHAREQLRLERLATARVVRGGQGAVGEPVVAPPECQDAAPPGS
jgi:hypothetical protein